MNLTTAEKFLLLAQHPGKGRFITSGIYINYGITGALIMEMTFRKKAAIENEKLVVKARKRSTDPIEAEIIATVGKFKKPRSVKRTLNKLSRNAGKYRGILLKQLARKGYLRIEEKTFLGFIQYKRHYLTNPKSRNELIRQLKDNLFYQKEISNEDAAVFGLLEACKMQRVLSSNKDELKVIRKQFKEKLSENAVASSVDKTIRQVQAAMMGAIVASAVAAGSSR